MDGADADICAGGAPEPRPTLAQLFGRLVDDGEDFIRAEVGLYRAQAGAKLLDARWIAAAFGAAILLGQGVLIASLVGLILALAPRLGPGWATLIVVGITLAAIALLIRIGVRRLKALLNPDDQG